MASERQISANRANAKLSTGPRSALGKAKVARNSLTHGGYVEGQAVLWGPFQEDAAHIERWHLHMVEALEPKDAFERTLASNIADLMVRMLRVRTYEDAIDNQAGLEMEAHLRRRGATFANSEDLWDQAATAERWAQALQASPDKPPSWFQAETAIELVTFWVDRAPEGHPRSVMAQPLDAEWSITINERLEWLQAFAMTEFGSLADGVTWAETQAVKLTQQGNALAVEYRARMAVTWLEGNAQKCAAVSDRLQRQLGAAYKIFALAKARKRGDGDGD
jgi:hypothetical protein